MILEWLFGLASWLSSNCI